MPFKVLGEMDCYGLGEAPNSRVGGVFPYFCETSNRSGTIIVNDTFSMTSNQCAFNGEICMRLRDKCVSQVGVKAGMTSCANSLTCPTISSKFCTG